MSEQQSQSPNTNTRKTWGIHGGIHPTDNKVQSLNEPIAIAGLPDELVLPLAQSIGAAAKPVVVLGQSVLKGELIAMANGFVSVPLHAPTSGKISAIEDRLLPHASGMSGPCICISPDGKDEWAELQSIDNFRSISADTLTKMIRDAGIAGMGGAGFPTAVKLSPPADKPIQTLIINGTECEPYITADHVLMREQASELILGIDILAHILNVESVLIGIEDNKPDAIESMTQAIDERSKDLRPIEVVPFPTKYPSGGEKQLIEILTGQQVPSGGLPADLGIVCQNIGTCYAIKQAIIDGIPLISRVTTITGESVSPRNLKVLLGTPMRYLLEQCGWQANAMSRLIMGGPMMGFTMPSADVPVVKTTNCILAPGKQELAEPAHAQACIRCGLCSQACPVQLLPQQLYWFARAKEYEKLEAHNLADCIECGACAYVCPSNIPLVQYYRASKADIRNRALEHQKAEQARERFEAREERLQRAEQEKEARRLARKEAAAKRNAAKAKPSGEQKGNNEKNGKSDDKASEPSSDKQTEIEAAIARVQAKKSKKDNANGAS